MLEVPHSWHGDRDASMAHAIMLYTKKPHVASRDSPGADEGLARAPARDPRSRQGFRRPPAQSSSPRPAQRRIRRSDCHPRGAAEEHDPVTISQDAATQDACLAKSRVVHGLWRAGGFAYLDLAARPLIVVESSPGSTGLVVPPEQEWRRPAGRRCSARTQRGFGFTRIERFSQLRRRRCRLCTIVLTCLRDRPGIREKFVGRGRTVPEFSLNLPTFRGSSDVDAGSRFHSCLKALCRQRWQQMSTEDLRDRRIAASLGHGRQGNA